MEIIAGLRTFSRSGYFLRFATDSLSALPHLSLEFPSPVVPPGMNCGDAPSTRLSLSVPSTLLKALVRNLGSREGY